MSGLAISFLVAVLAIVNPIGKVPIWTRAARGEDRGTEVWLAVLVMVTSGTILMLSFFFGRAVLQFLNIDTASFQVAGGVLIFLIGLDMIRGRAAQIDDDDEESEDASRLRQAKSRFRQIIVPVAIPIMAGPGSITTVIIYGARADSWQEQFILAAILGGILILIFLSLLLARYVEKLVGEISLDVVTRLFGMLLTAIAVQISATGIGLLFPDTVTRESPLWEDVEQERAHMESQ